MIETETKYKTNSERTKQWVIDNPERYKANQANSRARKRERQQEAVKYLKKTKHKTPMRAIRAFCRGCPNGTSRCGGNYLNAPVYCQKKKCPLFCFRNGNPVLIKRGMKSGLPWMRKDEV